MKRRLVSSLIVVLLLLLAYELGYWSGLSHAQKGVRLVVAKDTSDIQEIGSSSYRAGYDPYFTRQNPIPNKAK